MCGIAGVITSENSSTSLEEIANRMIASLQHRGPDSHGMWADTQAGLLLAHNRLAIQDLSEQGQQPMWSPSGRYCIVFNGEIYNFRMLSKELASIGYTFSGHSDTEVLLSAIEEWGLKSAVQLSVGMFAFAIWDAKEKILNLCRDRLGEKPLYYGWIKNSLYFASELKAIESVIPHGKLELDEQGLMKYLQYGYITAPNSIYRGIFKLIPGTILSLPVNRRTDLSGFSPCADSGRLSPETFWNVKQAANHGLENPILNHEEAVEELQTLLQSTIKMQKIADVGVGVFLSGGIDSSTVTAIAQCDSTSNVKTFSIGFTEKEYDESGFAERIAMHLGTDHSSINVSSSDALKVVPELPNIFDEPFADSSQIPTFLVSRFARDSVTVCLSGDGGDELFAGYNRYISANNIWAKISLLPSPLRRRLGRLLAIPTPGFWDNLYNKFYLNKNNDMKRKKLIGLKIQKLASFAQQSDQMSGYDLLLSYWNNPEELLFREAEEYTNCQDPGFPLTDNFINKAMYLDQIGYLPGDNLTKVDRASMAVSLETRLPLLSHELVELSWRIPVTMKVRDNVSKWVLREVLYRHVPKHLIERPKMGFSVPIAKWLREDLRDWAEDMLSLLKYSQPEILREEPIRAAWQEHQSGKYDHSQRLWTVLMLMAWSHARST